VKNGSSSTHNSEILSRLHSNVNISDISRYSINERFLFLTELLRLLFVVLINLLLFVLICRYMKNLMERIDDHSKLWNKSSNKISMIL
jgi:hypothetical protein